MEKFDIIASIEKNGIDKTFEGLQALNYETIKIFRESGIGELEQDEERFEFDLFAFSYYLLYLKNSDKTLEQKLLSIVVDFYAHIVKDISKRDPFFTSLVKDTQQYIKDKIKAYQQEIDDINTNHGYASKYIFASFHMYQLMTPNSISESCQQILEENIKAFQVTLNGVIEMLKSNSLSTTKFIE